MTGFAKRRADKITSIRFDKFQTSRFFKAPLLRGIDVSALRSELAPCSSGSSFGCPDAFSFRILCEGFRLNIFPTQALSFAFSFYGQDGKSQ